MPYCFLQVDEINRAVRAAHCKSMRTRIFSFHNMLTFASSW